jgi:hypothetical protein
MRYAEVTDEARERIRRLSERRLSAEELEAYVSAPMSDAEREEIVALIRWFRRRYPTVGERLAYVRSRRRAAP